MAHRWTPATSAAAYQAAASGKSARDIAAEVGCSRNAVIGVLYRHAVNNGLPSVRVVRAVARKPPEPPKPRPPAGASRAPVPRKAEAFPMTVVRGAHPVIPTCDAPVIGGATCGRAIHDHGLCLGHVLLRGDLRLRPPARRITSRARLLEEMEAALTRHHPTLKRDVRTAVGKLTSTQVTQAFHSGFVRLARECGWEQLDDDSFIQRRAA